DDHRLQCGRGDAGAHRRRSRQRHRGDESAHVPRGIHLLPYGSGSGDCNDHLCCKPGSHCCLYPTPAFGALLLMASGALSLPIRARPAFRSAYPHVMLYAAMLLVTVLALLPFVWAFVTSLKPERQIFALPPRLLPETITLYNYGRAVDHGLLL